MSNETPWTACNPPGSSDHRVFQARILEWVVISYSMGSYSPRDQTHVSCISCVSRWVLYRCTTWEAHFGPISFWRVPVLNSVKCLALSQTSTHQIPVANP